MRADRAAPISNRKATVCCEMFGRQRCHLPWSVKGLIVGQLAEVRTLTKRPENPSEFIAPAL